MALEDDFFEEDDESDFGMEEDDDPNYIEWLKSIGCDQITLRKQYLVHVLYPKLLSKHTKEKSKKIVSRKEI